MIPIILLILGLLFLFLEIILPSLILGTIGGALLIGAMVVFAILATSSIAVILFIALTVALVIALVKFTLSRIKKSKSIYLNQDQEGYVASSFAEELIGKNGEAITDLKPAGHIIVDGKKCQAVSLSGYIMKGDEVTVVGGEGGHLNVKLFKVKI